MTVSLCVLPACIVSCAAFGVTNDDYTDTVLFRQKGYECPHYGPKWLSETSSTSHSLH